MPGSSCSLIFAGSQHGTSESPLWTIPKVQGTSIWGPPQKQNGILAFLPVSPLPPPKKTKNGISGFPLGFPSTTQRKTPLFGGYPAKSVSDCLHRHRDHRHHQQAPLRLGSRGFRFRRALLGAPAGARGPGAPGVRGEVQQQLPAVEAFGEPSNGIGLRFEPDNWPLWSRSFQSTRPGRRYPKNGRRHAWDFSEMGLFI